MNRHPDFQSLSFELALKQAVHRVRKPDLFDLLLAKELKKIRFEIDNMNAISLRLQLLFITLHGGSVKDQLFLMEFERGVNS